MKDYLLIMGFILPIYLLIDHYLHRGKYQVEHIDTAMIFILFSVNIKQWVDLGFEYFAAAVFFLLLSSLFVLLVFLMNGIVIKVNENLDEVATAFQKHPLLKGAKFYDGISKKVYTLSNDIKIRLIKKKETTDISIVGKLNMGKIAEVRRGLLPMLIELDDRKYNNKGLVATLILSGGMIVAYFFLR